MNKHNIKTIGIGAIARVGKDLLAEMLQNKFEAQGIVAKRYALAYELKKDCEDFLKAKLNLDVWTNDTEEKKKFREFLVWYGKVKREESKGTYWTKLLQSRIIEDSKVCGDKFIAIVSDIRYSDKRFHKDEAYWIKKEMSGILINLNRKDSNGSFILPANDDEDKNAMRVGTQADYELLWRTEDEKSLITNYVDPLFEFLMKKFDLIEK